MAIPEPYRVVVVDDDVDLLPYLETSLRELSDFAIFSANNGADALERCYEVQPHCVVIDVRMPQLDGYQLVRALRGDPTTATIPLILLTAMAQDKDRFAGLAAGADVYVLKPVKPLELIALIQRTIAIDDAERQRKYAHLAQQPPPGR
jgi:two-component system alkaline phosphatase synthesis response regulator PhoP